MNSLVKLEAALAVEENELVELEKEFVNEEERSVEAGGAFLDEENSVEPAGAAKGFELVGASLNKAKGFVEEEKVKGFCETLGAFADTEEVLSEPVRRVR